MLRSSESFLLVLDALRITASLLPSAVSRRKRSASLSVGRVSALPRAALAVWQAVKESGLPSINLKIDPDASLPATTVGHRAPTAEN
jgi:hypothetical protein